MGAAPGGLHPHVKVVAGDCVRGPDEQIVLQGRHGIYDMVVRNQRGETVALFRGKSAQIPGTVFPEDEAPE